MIYKLNLEGQSEIIQVKLKKKNSILSKEVFCEKVKDNKDPYLLKNYKECLSRISQDWGCTSVLECLSSLYFIGFSPQYFKNNAQEPLKW
jgi:hypothetical protein